MFGAPKPGDDYRHALMPGEHEAFYFPLTSTDGAVFGILRALFSPDSVREAVILRVDDCVWAYAQHTPLPPNPAPGQDASGPALALTCLEPWQSWLLRFHSTVRQVRTGTAKQAELEMTFTATGAPEEYHLGHYHQGQQDGQLNGQIRIGSETWEGELLCPRDHSWGQRPVQGTRSWVVASAPGGLYAVTIEQGAEQTGFGRFVTPDGRIVSLQYPRFTAVGEEWLIEDPQTGLAWRARRLTPPLVGYLGPSGKEELRDEPLPGDLLRDQVGPALFTSPERKQFTGILEQAEGLDD
jgi:hypothetical protein